MNKRRDRGRPSGYRGVKVLTVLDTGIVLEGRVPLTSVLPELLSTLLQLVPLGRVTTYGDLADVLGVHPRYVGRLIRGSRLPIAVPCHRVVMSDGSLGGYTLNGRSNVYFKKALLELEGVRVSGNKVPKGYILDKLV